MKDRWVKCISKTGTIRGVAVQARGVLQEMIQRHRIKDASAQRLGEATVGALFSAAYCEQGGRVNLNVRTEGRYHQVFVDAHWDGKVRGYLVERDAAGAASEKGPWGEGVISLLRTRSQRDSSPYIGTVPLVTGHLAKDLTFYWAQSEQTPSAIGLGVEASGDQITSAGGFMIQAMPGATHEEVLLLEKEIEKIGGLVNELSKGSEPVQLLAQLFQNMSFLVLEEKPIQFSCTCSQERVESALALIEIVELRQMIEKEGKAEIRCDFCGAEYEVPKKGLEKILHEKIAAATRKLRKELAKGPPTKKPRGRPLKKKKKKR